MLNIRVCNNYSRKKFSTKKSGLRKTHTHNWPRMREKFYIFISVRTGQQQPASQQHCLGKLCPKQISPTSSSLRNAETPWNDTKLVIGRAVRAVRKNINEDGKILWIIFAALKFPASESSKTTTTLFSDWIKSCAGTGKLSDRKLLATEQTRFRWFSHEWCDNFMLFVLFFEFKNWGFFWFLH